MYTTFVAMVKLIFFFHVISWVSIGQHASEEGKSKTLPRGVRMFGMLPCIRTQTPPSSYRAYHRHQLTCLCFETLSLWINLYKGFYSYCYLPVDSFLADRHTLSSMFLCPFPLSLQMYGQMKLSTWISVLC